MQDKRKRNNLFLFFIVIGFSVIVIFFFITSRVIAETGDDATQNQLKLFLEVFNFVRVNYVDEGKIDPDVLVQGALKGMLEALEDPYSVYMSATDMDDMHETTLGKFGGVGLYILEDEKGIEVARPMIGTPAFRAGISAADIIIGVDDESVVELDIDSVIERLKGEPGTDVKITVLRGDTKTLDFTVTRAMIEIPTIRKDMIDDTTAYLKINQFTPLTSSQVKEALDYFSDQGYRDLVIDLRSNPGGLLSSVVDIADMFFPYGKLIVYTKSRIASENYKYRAKHKATVPDSVDIIVLIDKYSASAAEILTGVLKDHQRAKIVGETSYGKGSVQILREIPGGGGIKLTVSKYYTPSGVVIDKVGIDPDVEVPEEEWKDEDREALNKLYDSEKITDFINDHPNPGTKEINGFIKALEADGIVLAERYVKKLIRNEVNRTNNDPPVFDLDYDLVLQKAMEILKK